MWSCVTKNQGDDLQRRSFLADNGSDHIRPGVGCSLAHGRVLCGEKNMTRVDCTRDCVFSDEKGFCECPEIRIREIGGAVGCGNYHLACEPEPSDQQVLMPGAVCPCCTYRTALEKLESEKMNKCDGCVYRRQGGFCDCERLMAAGCIPTYSPDSEDMERR